MLSQESHRLFCEQIGFFLEYPVDDFRKTLMDFINQMEPVSSRSSDYLRDFLGRMKRMELRMWQEFYVQTFDLTPQCPLYISVHLFGEESFKRAELMTGLKIAYERNGEKQFSELPDHLAVVLRQNSLLNDEEWSEFVTMCLFPALSIMVKKLEKNANPYVFILKALQELLIGAEKSYV